MKSFLRRLGSVLLLVLGVAALVNWWADRDDQLGPTDLADIPWLVVDPAAQPPGDAGPPREGDTPIEGDTQWITAPGGTGVVGSGPLYRYRVEVERATGWDAAAVAEVVDYALGHPRGWTAGGLSVQRVSSGETEMVVRLATPETVDLLCAPLQTNGEVSCRQGDDVVLNLVRWNEGVAAYEGDVAAYRIMLINHEVGHLLGHHQHVPCPGPGRPGPVMMQVYYDGLQGCVKNSWPYAEDGTFIG